MIRTLCPPRRAALLAGLLALAVLASGNGRASADFLFSNLGADNSFSTTSYASANNDPFSVSSLAYAFTPTSSGQVTSIEIAVGQGSYNGTTGYAYLESDNGGVPGSVLMSGPNTVSWSFALPTSPTLLTLDVPDIYPYPEVTAGQQYWVVLAPPAPADSYYLWYENSTNQKGPMAQNAHGSWTATQNILEGAFAIEGTPTSTVPEPASASLLGIGLATVWLFRRRGRPSPAK